MNKLERTAEPVNTPMRTEAFYTQREAFALLSAEEVVAAAMRTAAGIAAALLYIGGDAGDSMTTKTSTP